MERRGGGGQKEGEVGVNAKKEETMEEVRGQVMMVLNSTDRTGVVHESVNSWDEKDWTRSWFGWANGLFGELIIRIAEEEERSGKIGMLAKSWQE